MSVLFLRGAARYTPHAGPGPGPGTTTIATAWSQTLPDSFGVNTHVTYGKNHAGQQNAYQLGAAGRTPDQQLAYAVGLLGATHVREVIGVGNGTQRSRLKALNNATGVTVLFVSAALQSTPNPPTGAAIAADILTNYTVGGQLIVDGVSGINEPDISHVSGQVSKTTTLQSQLWASSLNGQVSILGPSMGSDNSAYNAYGNLSGVCNVGDLHTYPGGYTPDNRISVHYNASRTMYGPAKHVWTTEGGYENATNFRGGNPPVPENVSVYYIPREILENFIYPGVDRFYPYELVDQYPDAGLTNRERHFGQFRYNWTAKPQAVACGRMMRLASDPGAAFTPPATIAASIDGGDHSTRWFNLQKRDGTNLLHVWRNVSLGTPSTSAAFKPAAVTPITVTLNLPYSVTVLQYEPSTNTSTGDTTPTPVRSTTGTAHPVPLAAGVVVLSFPSPTVAPSPIPSVTGYTATYGATY